MQVEFNNKLDRLLQQHQIKFDAVAVGVSGGADSLALVLLLKNWAEKKNKKIVALTVDHGLRKESTEESLFVGKLMQKNNIEHHILPWIGEKPSSSMEEEARNARYALLKEFCDKNEIKFLMIAHHKLDQVETFFMRLQRGSGVDGLSGMAELSEMNGLQILRPLLSFDPDDLRAFLHKEKIKWIDDPHNFQDDFLRVRVRKFIPELKKNIDLDVDRVVDAMAVLARTKSYMQEQTQHFIKNNVKLFGEGGACFSKNAILSQHEEIAFRVLSCLIRKIGGNYYNARADSIERLREAMLGKFKGCTLGGCEFMVFDGKFWIVKELKSKIKLSKKEWNNFLEENPSYKKVRLPYKLRLCLATTNPILDLS